MSTPSAAAYEIKSADLPLVAFQLRSVDMQAVARELAAQLQETPGFFEQDPALIDLDSLPDEAGEIDFKALVALLQAHQLRPVALRSQRAQWLQAGLAAGLLRADDARIRRAPPTTQPAPTAPAMPAAPAEPVAAMVLDKPLRSGQQVYAKGRDLVVLAMVNPGAEILADGHIHVYAPLRGKAIAGARGFTGARIFAQAMDPELISIAGVYRTSDNPLPESVRGHAAQVLLQAGPEGDRLQIQPLAT